MLPGHVTSFKNHKNGFFNDPMKDQNKHLRILMTMINETLIIQGQDTEVEICDAVTLQFSTSVEVRPGNVSVSVSPFGKVTENRAKDFDETWYEVKG